MYTTVGLDISIDHQDFSRLPTKNRAEDFSPALFVCYSVSFRYRHGHTTALDPNCSKGSLLRNYSGRISLQSQVMFRMHVVSISNLPRLPEFAGLSSDLS